MKPADRALEMVVVGLGQAGGNLATEFARLGYRALALNTAHTDLSSLAPGQRQFALAAEQRIYIGIDGYDGAGADLNFGRECVQENSERIKDAVANHAEGADVVLLTAGLGGGTGSSVSELVNVLKEGLDVPMIAMATLPNEYESGIAKVNAVRAVSDLVKHTDIGWIFADNSRLSQIHGGVSLDKYFEKVNSVIVQPLDHFNRLNERPGVHPIRTLDGEDFRALLLSNGVINYAENELPALTVESVIERVRENLQTSSMMPAGFSPEEVSYMGVVLEASEEVLAGTPFTLFEQLNEQLKDETGGGAIYMGVYRTDEPMQSGAALLRMIASTQSLPEGIQGMVNDARREGGTLRDKLQRSMSSLDLGEIEDFDLFKTTLRSSQGGPARRRPSAADDLNVPEPMMNRPSARSSKATKTKDESSAEKEAEPDAGPKASRFGQVAAKPPSTEPKPVQSAAAAEATKAVEAAASESNVDEPEPTPMAASGTFDDEPDLVEASSVGEEEFEELAADELVDEGEEIDDDEVVEADADELDEGREAEAANYAKLVATFLRTEFDSTRKRVARRLDQAMNDSDDQTRQLAEQAVERIREEGMFSTFEKALQDDAVAPSAGA